MGDINLTNAKGFDIDTIGEDGPMTGGKLRQLLLSQYQDEIAAGRMSKKEALQKVDQHIVHTCSSYPKLIGWLQDFLGDIPTIDSQMDGHCCGCGEPCKEEGEECFNPKCLRVEVRAFLKEFGHE